MRKETGAIVFALERHGAPIQEGLADLPLRPGDVIHVAGTDQALANAMALSS